MTGFLNAVRKNDVDRVRRELEGRASPNCIDERTSDTPLLIAAWNGNLELVQLLLDHGADPELCPSDPPIVCAAGFGHSDIVTALLDAGADVDAVDSGKSSALMSAASGGHIEIVRALLESGADAMQRDSDDESAIMFAAKKGHRGIVDLLRSNSSPADNKTADAILGIERQGPLRDAEREFLEAIKLNDTRSVAAYVNSGGEVNVVDRHGLNALHYAMSSANLGMLDLLIGAGADVNQYDVRGEYPLYDAVNARSELLYQHLLPHTSNQLRSKAAELRDKLIKLERWRWDRPDIKKRFANQEIDKEDIQTVLNMATRSLYPGVERKLFEALRQNPNCANAIEADGTTMLMLAVRSNNPRLVEFLVKECELDPNETNIYGHCALREARPQRGYPNPGIRQKIYDFLYARTKEELRKRVESTIAREAATSSDT